MRRYIEFLQQYRWPCLILALVVFAGALWQLVQLRLETDWHRLFPYPDKAEMVDMLGRISSVMGVPFIFCSTNDQPVVLYGDAVADMAERITQSGLFAEVVFDVSARGGALQPHRTLAFMAPADAPAFAERLTLQGMQRKLAEQKKLLFSPAAGIMAERFRNDPLDLAAFGLERMSWRSGYRVEDGYLVSSDGGHMLVMAFLPGDGLPAGDLDRLYQLMVDVRRQAEEEGLRCRMPGSVFLRAELHHGVRRDLLRSCLVSVIAVGLLFTAVYRARWRLICCMLMPLLFSIVLTFGLYALFSRSVDMITALAAVMLVGLGVDFGIHLNARYVAEPGGTLQRLSTALTGTGRGIAGSALTSAIAFLSILVTGMRSFYLLGITAAVGILSALLAYYTLYPLCVLVFRPAARCRAGAHQAWAGLYRHATACAVIFIACLLPAAVLGIPRIRFVGDYSMFLPKDSRALNDMQALVGGADRRNRDGLVIQVAATSYARDSALAARLAKAFPEADWKSPWSLLPDATQLHALRQSLKASLRERGLTPTTVQANMQHAFTTQGLRPAMDMGLFINGIYEALEPGAFEQWLYELPLVKAFFSDDGSCWYLMAVHDNGRAWTADERTQVRRMLGDTGEDAVILSGAGLIEQIRQRAVPETIRAMLVALLLILLLMGYWFRRISRVLLVFVPTAAGLTLTFACMGLFGIPFSFFNMTVVPLIIGLGIDDGIHFVQAEHEYHSARRALAATAAPILLTTLTTCLGFGSLMTVSFKGIMLMGLMIVMGLVACLVSTVLLLPAACAWRHGSGCHGLEIKQ